MIYNLKDQFDNLIGRKVFDWVFSLRRMNSGGNRIPNQLRSPDFDPDTNAIAMAAVWWGIRNISEATFVVMKKEKDGKVSMDYDHKASKVLATPNPYKFDQARLLGGIVYSLLQSGNAYLLPGIQTFTGEFLELYWEPHWRMEPIYDDNDPSNPLIAAYKRTLPNGKFEFLDPDFVIHIALGVDPLCPSKGLNPIRAIEKWLAIDDEAALMQLAMMKQRASKTTIVSPENPEGLNDVSGKKLQRDIQNATTGYNRGRTVVTNNPIKTQEIGGSISEFELGNILKQPEKKVAAAYGIPLIVLGLIDDPKYSNYGVAKRLATEDFLCPLWRIIGSALTNQFLPHCGGKRGEFIAADLTNVRALQEDQDNLHVRVDKDYMADIITRGEARAIFGYKTDPDDDGFNSDILAASQNPNNAMTVDSEDMQRDGPAPRRGRDRRLQRDGNGPTQSIPKSLEIEPDLELISSNGKHHE